MAEQFIGCTVSIEVGGGLGFYQGTVKSVNTTKQLVTLLKVLHNGKPTNTAEVIISAEDILDLKILHSKDERLIPALSEKPVQSSITHVSYRESSILHNQIEQNIVKSYPYSISNDNTSASLLLLSSQKHSNCESSLNENHLRYGFKPVKVNNDENFTKDEQLDQFQVSIRSKASVGETLAHGSFVSADNRNIYDRSGMNCIPEFGYQKKNFELPRTPNKRLLRKNYRDETTFGTPIDEDVLNTEFDFEKNLALFDKQAVMEEIQSLKPDVIRQADRKSEKKYRCDENVIASKPLSNRQIIVPAADAGEIIYATDNGLLVPSVTTELRMNLMSTANQHGLTKSRQLEMIGRAATEIIMSVIGGSHRLEPGNSHQAPVVVLLCGAHVQGAAGANCGRQLESQGVRTVVTTPPIPSSQTPSLLLSQEAQLYSLTTGRMTTDPNSLPSTVDLIVDARYDLQGNVALGIETSSWVAAVNVWSLSSRAPIVALDPPTTINLPLTPRILLSPALPLAYLPDKGKVYLLNINIPQQVFSYVGIKYTPPFGPKMVIPLHPCE